MADTAEAKRGKLHPDSLNAVRNILGVTPDMLPWPSLDEEIQKQYEFHGWAGIVARMRRVLQLEGSSR
jgi:hypothetical protein